MSLFKGVKQDVIAGLILAGLLYLCSLIPGFYPAIWNFLKATSIYLVGSATLPRWALFLLILLSAIFVLRGSSRLFRGSASPSMFDYREDTILGLTWRWDYGPHGPTNVWCYCPTCDTSLVYSEDRDWTEYGQGRNLVILRCETCGNRVKDFEGDRDYLISRVLRQIDRIQRSGEWKKRIPDATAKA